MHTNRTFKSSAAALFTLLALLVVGAASAAAATPETISVSPSAGLTSGGTTVTIRGNAFTSDSSVTFGGVPASSVSVDSDSQITAVAPAGPAGTVDVRVTTADGTSAIKPYDQFRYGGNAPENLALDGATSSRVALQWTAPAVPSVLSYTVSRDGTTVATLSKYKTNFVDTGLAAGTTYTYAITAQTLSGPTPASAPLQVTTPTSAQTTTLTQCSSTSLPSGNYVLGNDLMGTAGCLKFDSVSDVTLDCQGHSIDTTGASTDPGNEVLYLLGVTHAFVTNCKFPSVGYPVAPATEGALRVENSTYVSAYANDLGSFGGNPYGTPNLLKTFGASHLAFTNNTVTNSELYVWLASDSYIGANTIVESPDHTTATAIADKDGHGNVFEGNSIDGSAIDPASGDNKGSDDGFLLDSASNDTITGNDIQRVWDAGAETIGYSYSTLITGNNIAHAWVDGVGAYGFYQTSWFNNSVTDNTLDDSGNLIYITDGTTPDGELNTYFKYNTFDGNVGTHANGFAGTYDRGESRIEITRPETISGENRVTNNKFATGPYYAPNLLPASAFTDFSNNSCGLRPG
ncbi:MAG TPA: IPT/TIG domain-containing protein, partial [Candidatus Acidoferrales bacterium]|nr:IPT/TIG domain-containing protein [Candidatus Acidoferrales bacterium]